MKLTEKQERFIDYYIETDNAAEAARKAGYSKRTANRIGSENLKKTYIQQAIKKRLEELKNERNRAVFYTKNLLLDVDLYVYTCYNKINKGGMAE